MALPRRCLHGVHLWYNRLGSLFRVLCLGAACTECIFNQFRASFQGDPFASALPARSASPYSWRRLPPGRPLPRRCLHGVHPAWAGSTTLMPSLCLGAACTECICGGLMAVLGTKSFASALPARSASSELREFLLREVCNFASALPARSASAAILRLTDLCTDFASALPARSASGSWQR